MKEKWLEIDLYSEENKPKISRIIQIESVLTEAIRNGHQAHLGDEYREIRNEMLRLRREVLNSK